MTLLFADGFEDGLDYWTVSGTWAALTGRTGTGYGPGSTSGSLTMGIPTTFGPIILGFAYKPSSGAQDIVNFMNIDSAGDLHVAIRRGASGEVIVIGGAGGAGIGTSAIGVLPAGAWSYVEVKVYVHDTAGTVEVRVNGTTILNLSSVDTRNSSSALNGIKLGFVGGNAMGVGTVFDDFYLCNASGAYNNDFLGDLTVEHLRPTGNDTSDWVGSDGNSTDNYLLVDEAGAAVTADYVQSSTVAQRDLYTIGPSARTGGAAGVLVFTNVSKTTSAPRGFKHTIKEGSAGTVRQATEMGLPTSFGELFSIFERKADGSVWLISDVNALRVGVELTT